MSLTDLVSLLNEAARTGNALVAENENDLIVSEIRADLTLQMMRLAEAASLAHTAYDSEFSECEDEDIEGDPGLFRITLKKPSRTVEELANTLYILTEVGFTDFLRKGHAAGQWRIFGLTALFTTQAQAYGDWDHPLSLALSSATKSPRMLVKEASDIRSVPDDIRLFLLNGSSLDASDSVHRLWAQHAFEALSQCIANEVSASDRKLIFKGPPKLSLEFLNQPQMVSSPIELSDFQRVHDAAAWVYESAREVEVKHVLLSTEIARSGRADGEVIAYLRDNLDAALDCAKIAYQMSISDVTKDTLKSLGDLRKAVTEETSKATDATRQTVTAITTAAGVGIGLAVARISVALNPWLVFAVMVVVWLYVVTIALSGWHFILVQRGLRDQWQTKLYRFLPASDYESMVTTPVGRSEAVFKRTAISGVAVLAAWAVCVVVFAFNATPTPSKPGETKQHLEQPKAEPSTPKKPEKSIRSAPNVDFSSDRWALQLPRAVGRGDNTYVG